MSEVLSTRTDPAWSSPPAGPRLARLVARPGDHDDTPPELRQDK